jgi:signal peptidase I
MPTKKTPQKKEPIKKSAQTKTPKNKKNPKKVVADKTEKVKDDNSKKVVLKFLNILTYTFGTIIIVSYGLLFSLRLLTENNMSLFSFRLYRIGSGSMSPTFEIGDDILIQETKDFAENDIITYTVNEENCVTHRVVSIDSEKIITKGDANNIADEAIEKNTVIGKYIKRADYFNFISNYKFPLITFLGILIFALILFKK